MSAIKEIYLGATKVRPTGWTPGENTILYLPLKGDLIDYSGNNNTVTNHGCILGTYQGISCLDTNGSPNYLEIQNISNNLNGESNRAISFWTYVYSVGFWTCFNQSVDNWGASGFGFEDTSLGIRYGNPTNRESYISINFPYNTWVNMVVTVINGGAYAYINNTKYTISSTGIIAPVNNSNTLYINKIYRSSGYGNAYLSNYILEDKGWTDQDVADYYNITKGDYGIS